MTMIDRKSKMVSFRLSPEEYRQLRDACAARGLRSVSELARTSMQSVISSGNGSSLPLHQQMQELRERVTQLSDKIDRLTGQTEPRAYAASANSCD